MNKGDILYYYNEKYPEYGVKKFEIKEVEITKLGSDEYITGVTTNWNIQCDIYDIEDKYGHYYNLYQPTNNKDIYYHDMANYENRSLVLSTNEDIIYDKCRKECEWKKKELEKSLNRIEKILNDDYMLKGDSNE